MNKGGNCPHFNLNQVQDDDPIFVIPNSIWNPRIGKLKGYFEPWILNQVQDD